MESERSGDTRESEGLPGLPFSRGVGLVLGIITIILGIIIAARPTQSLTVIAVLLGVVMMVSGVFHVVRAIGGREQERVWRGLSGVLFFMVGLALIRHINLSVALIGLFIGIAWVIQGVSALVESFAPGREREETGWTVFFGIISLIAGIVVVAAPIASVTALTIFMGIWFIVMGIMEIIGSFVVGRALRAQTTEGVSVPPQRAETVGQRDVADHPAAGGTGPSRRDFTG
jgi:uncharacterized membrane protein HdeD (DUF308 family)